MSLLDIAGLQITNLTAYNEYITDIIIAVIIYLAAFSLVIKLWLAGRKKAREAAPAQSEPDKAQPEAAAAEQPAGKEAQG